MSKLLLELIVVLTSIWRRTQGRPVVILGRDQSLLDYSNYWLTKLLLNLIGYSIIVVPLVTLVFLVKNKLCLCSEKSFLVKVLVYGIEKQHGGDESLHKMIEDGDDRKNRLPQVVRGKTSSKGRLRSGLLLGYCFLGLQVSYLTWGILQERIMTTEYVVSHPISNASHFHGTVESVIHFHDSQFLVLVNRILASIFALVAICVTRAKKPNYESHSKGYTVAPLYEFVFCSLSNILSSWCQYEALKFVNFPTQVLSKACKILPVMLMSQVVSGKKYQTRDYLFALAISLGMCFFLFGDHKDNGIPGADSSYNLLDGLFVLALYLTFDSFTSNWQGKLFDKYKISSFQMMAGVNFYSLLLTLTSLTEQGDLFPALRMVFSSFQLAKDCFILSLCSASGQLFVFYTISTFGPIVFVTIMTLRQAFAILLSCLIYNHSLSALSIFGILLLFATLFIQTYTKCKKK